MAERRLLTLPGPVTVDLETGGVRGRRTEDLTTNQLALLVALVERAGELWRPAELVERVWGRLAPLPEDEARQRHLLAQTVYALRKKLEPDPKQPRFLPRDPDGYRCDPTFGAFDEIPLVHRSNLGSGEMPRLFGRLDLLASVAAALDPPAFVGISGPPGVGKTAFLRRLGLGLTAQFKGGGVWMLTTRGLLCDRDLHQALTELLKLSPTADAARLSKAIERRGRTLIILDDLDAWPAAGERLVALAPTSCALLFSARSVESLPPGTTAFAMGPLSEGAASELLNAEVKHATGHLPSERLRVAAARMGRLPGAICLMARAAAWWGEGGLLSYLDAPVPAPLGVGDPDALSTILDGLWASCNEAERAAWTAAAAFVGPLPAAAAAALNIAPATLETLERRGLLWREDAGFFQPLEVGSAARRLAGPAMQRALSERDSWVINTARALRTPAALQHVDALRTIRALSPELRVIESGRAAQQDGDGAAEALLLAMPALALDDPAGAIERIDRALRRPGLGEARRSLLYLERGGGLLRQHLSALALRDLRAVNPVDVEAHARALVGIGQACLARDDLNEAERAFDQAIALARSHDLCWVEGRAQAGRALLFRRLGQSAARDDAHRGAMSCARRAQDWQTQGRALGNQALWLRWEGRMGEALAALREVIATYRRAGDVRAELVARFSLGNYLMDAGDIDGARCVLQEVLSALEAAALPERLAAAEGDLALIEALDGDLTRARERCYRALATLRGCEAPGRIATVEIQRAIVEAVAGDLATAQVALTEARRLAMAHNLARELAWAQALLRLLGQDYTPDTDQLNPWLAALIARFDAANNAQGRQALDAHLRERAGSSVSEQLVRAIIRSRLSGSTTPVV